MKTICITCKADCHNAGTMARIIECSSYEPGRILTNADRIRAMSDEKLAEHLVVAANGLQPCTLYYSLPTDRSFVSESEAVRITLDWLQQPAEEEP